MTDRLLSLALVLLAVSAVVVLTIGMAWLDMAKDDMPCGGSPLAAPCQTGGTP